MGPREGSKNDPKNDPFLGHFWTPFLSGLRPDLGHFWSKSGSKNDPKNDPKMGHFGSSGGTQKGGSFHPDPRLIRQNR